jgi:hypothetical protein
MAGLSTRHFKKNVISNPWRAGNCMARVRNLIRGAMFAHRPYKISPHPTHNPGRFVRNDNGFKSGYFKPVIGLNIKQGIR